MDEVYFVGSDGKTPEQVYLDKEEALAANHTYVDSFNKEGLKVASYKVVAGYWTADF